jgi:predicted nuclease of predicted toxin-antitoxin system
MPLAFLLDEQLRGPLWRAVLDYNASAVAPMDAVRIGGVAGLPTGVKDEQILKWAEEENRIVVSRDRDTLPRHLKNHLTSGRHSPGIVLIRREATFQEILEWLDLIAQAGDSTEFADSVTYIP